MFKKEEQKSNVENIYDRREATHSRGLSIPGLILLKLEISWWAELIREKYKQLHVLETSLTSRHCQCLLTDCLLANLIIFVVHSSHISRHKLGSILKEINKQIKILENSHANSRSCWSNPSRQLILNEVLKIKF